MKSRMFEAVSYVDDWYLDMVDTPPKEILPMKEKKHVSPRKFVSVLVAAVICASILAVTAMAAGWIPNIFREVQEEYPWDKELFEEAAQSPQSAPEVVEIPQMDLSKFTLYERYYDGEMVLLGYNLDAIIPDAVVGYEPNEEELAKITEKPLYTYSLMEGQTNDTLEQYVELGEYTEEDYNEILQGRSEHAKEYDLRNLCDIRMDLELQEMLTPEQYERFWDILAEKGHCCVVTSSMYLSDHKKINGVEIYDPVENPDMLLVEYETDAGNCIRMENLPKTAQDQDSITVEMVLRSGRTYYYMELDGNCYRLYEPVEEQALSFALDNVNKIPTE